MLDTTPDTAKMKWASLPPFPGAGRILSTAAVCDSTLFIAGGCTLSRDAAGETARTYLSDMIGYDMTSNDPAEWGAAGKQQPAGPGTPVAAAAGPAPVRENSIILIGGDKRGNAPDPSPWCSPATSWFMTSSETNGRTRGSGPSASPPRPPS